MSESILTSSIEFDHLERQPEDSRDVVWERDLLWSLIVVLCCYLLLGDVGFWVGLYLAGAAWMYAAQMGWNWGHGHRRVTEEPGSYAWSRSGVLDDYCSSVVFGLLGPLSWVFIVADTEWFRYGFRWAYPPEVWEQVSHV